MCNIFLLRYKTGGITTNKKGHLDRTGYVENNEDVIITGVFNFMCFGIKSSIGTQGEVS